MGEFIIQCKITPQMVKVAKNLSLKETLDKSITKGERNVMGTLGELCTLKLLSTIHDLNDIEYEPNYNYDLTLNDVKVDVKSKQRKVQPRADYAASIVAYTKDKQLCDFYMFTNITVGTHDEDFKEFYFLGYMPKTEYFSKATFMRKGQSDGGNHIQGKGEFKIRADCYNLPYSHLRQYPIEALEETTDAGFKIIQW